MMAAISAAPEQFPPFFRLVVQQTAKQSPQSTAHSITVVTQRELLA
jgi:hypothetical protein